VPHGRVGQAREEHPERDGWTLPIYRFVEAADPLTLDELITDVEREWIYNWIGAMDTEITSRISGGEVGLAKVVAAPFQRYGIKTGRNELRAQQGYLSKMPFDFVQR
jgi:hypothetical protein